MTMPSMSAAANAAAASAAHSIVRDFLGCTTPAPNDDIASNDSARALGIDADDSMRSSKNGDAWRGGGGPGTGAGGALGVDANAGVDAAATAAWPLAPLGLALAPQPFDVRTSDDRSGSSAGGGASPGEDAAGSAATGAAARPALAALAAASSSGLS